MALFVISGVSAAGKSTVARLLAERFARGVCVHGDEIRAMVVETDRIGLWLDTSPQSAGQTVEAILGDLDASRVRVSTRPG